jgi:uncharacterized protein YndB with AHSA1/START domain
VSPARVFAAWSDPKIKARWFGSPDEDSTPKIFEFKVGGREYNSGIAPNGQSYTFDGHYRDIVADNRIVYTYEMELNDKRISVSLATIELKPQGSGTHMVVTEMGAFLDGLDTVKQREEGTVWLMDQLGTELQRQAAEG